MRKKNKLINMSLLFLSVFLFIQLCAPIHINALNVEGTIKNNQQQEELIRANLLNSEITTVEELLTYIQEAKDAGENAITIVLNDDIILDLSNYASSILLDMNHDMSITIDGDGKTIADFNNFIFVIDNAGSGNYIFKNMKFINTQGGFQIKSGEVTIDNIDFNGLSKVGIEASLSTSNLKVTNCHFNNNTATSIQVGKGKNSISNSEFTNQSNYGIAKLSKAYGSVIEIDNCYFYKLINNGGGHGSAVLIEEQADVSIINSTFEECGGTYAGGYSKGAVAFFRHEINLTIDQCYFLNNYGGRYGGAISMYQFGGTAVISNSYFEGNSVSGQGSTSDGGAIGQFNNSQKSDVTIAGCTFDSNYAEDDGAAIFLENGPYNAASNNTDAHIYNNTFYNNRGNGISEAQGGFIYDGGGAIQLSLRVNAYITQNTFYKNTHEKGNGAIGEHYYAEISFPIKYYRPYAEITDNLIVDCNTSPIYTISSKDGFSDNNIGQGSIYPTSYDIFGTDDAVLIPYGSAVGNENHSTRLAAYSTIYPKLDESSQTAYAVGKYKKTDTDARGYTRHADTPDVGAIEVYGLVFDANGGAWKQQDAGWNSEYSFFLPNSSTMTKSVAITNPSGTINTAVAIEPTRENYTFLGWFDAPEDGNKVTSITPIQKDNIVYAYWEENTVDFKIIDNFHLWETEGEEDRIIIVYRTGNTDESNRDFPNGYPYTYDLQLEVDGELITQEQLAEVTWDVEAVGNFYELYDYIKISDGKNEVEALKSGVVKVTATYKGSSSSIYIVIPGDVDRNTIVNSTDAARVNNYNNTSDISKLGIVDQFTLMLADMNGDQQINSTDAAIIHNMNNGVIDPSN